MNYSFIVFLIPSPPRESIPSVRTIWGRIRLELVQHPTLSNFLLWSQSCRVYSFMSNRPRDGYRKSHRLSWPTYETSAVGEVVKFLLWVTHISIAASKTWRPGKQWHQAKVVIIFLGLKDFIVKGRLKSRAWVATDFSRIMFIWIVLNWEIESCALFC